MRDATVAILAPALGSFAAPAVRDTPRVMGPGAALVCVDDGFTRFEEDEVLRGIEQWQHALRDRVHLAVVPIDGREHRLPAQCDFYVLRTERTIEWLAGVDHATLGGFAEDIGGRVAWVVTDVTPPGQIHCVVAHELGHLFGLRHAPTGFMHRYVTCAPIPDGTAEDHLLRRLR
jgi:hypothetical protein